MTPSREALQNADALLEAEAFARESHTTLEEMFSSRKRPAASARMAFIRWLSDEQGWPVKRIAALLERNVWTIHSAVYHEGRDASRPKRSVGAERDLGGLDERALGAVATAEQRGNVSGGKLASPNGLAQREGGGVLNGRPAGEADGGRVHGQTITADQATGKQRMCRYGRVLGVT